MKCVVCVVFNDKYEFEGLTFLGIAHSDSEANSLVLDSMLEKAEENSGKCEVYICDTAYEDTITIATTKKNKFHYYCFSGDAN